MRFFSTVVLALVCASFLYSQNVRVEKPILTNESAKWGSDYVLLPNEPVGPMYAVQGADSAIYVAINDTLSTTNLGLVVRKSTDGGSTWNTASGVTYRGIYENIKLLRGANAVYCLFQIDYSIFCWNVASDTVRPFIIPGYRAFDAEISSSNTIYLFLDSLANNTLLRYSSLNGGANWINRGNISTGAAFPKVTKSLSGDTLFLNYFGPVLPDTLTSILRVARYREIAPGTVSSAGFQDLATETVLKKEYGMAINNGEVYFVYTTAGTKSELWMRKSADNGTTYAPAVKINTGDNVEQYLFDIKAKRDGSGSFNFVYYSDSVQTGPASAQTDRILFGTAPFGSATFAPFTQINELPAALPSAKCRTQLVELPFFSNTGVVWIGEDGGGKKVFWDSYNNVIPVELTSFTAAVSGASVMLNWETATETNNYGFQVEKLRVKREELRVDEWEAIGFVTGSGTSTNKKDYSFTDKISGDGIISYRLKQIDLDGSFSYSKIIEVDATPAREYKLEQNYPNPFNPSTKIIYRIPLSGGVDADGAGGRGVPVQLKVFDILGREVATLVNEAKAPGNHEISFNASELPSGIYIYELRSGDVRLVNRMMLIK